MVAYITVGAKTTHGGTVITGSPQTTHYGIPIARKGDKVVCKKCKKVVTIITGDPSYIVDGAPVARAGDMTSCGSKLIASQQAFSESGFDVGSISDEMTDEELYALNDQMIEDAIADGGLTAEYAMSSRKGLTNDSKAPTKPTGYNRDGTKQTQKQINDAWVAYYDHKNKAEALSKQQAEDRSFFDKAKDFLGFDDDAQVDNTINTARNAAITGAKLPGTGTMAVGDTVLSAGPSVYGGFDTELRKDYDYFVREGRLPDKPGASAFPPYEKARQRINKELIEKHKGAGWTEPGKNGRSPQNDVWGKK